MYAGASAGRASSVGLSDCPEGTPVSRGERAAAGTRWPRPARWRVVTVQFGDAQFNCTSRNDR